MFSLTCVNYTRKMKIYKFVIVAKSMSTVGDDDAATLIKATINLKFKGGKQIDKREASTVMVGRVGPLSGTRLKSCFVVDFLEPLSRFRRKK